MSLKNKAATRTLHFREEFYQDFNSAIKNTKPTKLSPPQDTDWLNSLNSSKQQWLSSGGCGDAVQAVSTVERKKKNRKKRNTANGAETEWNNAHLCVAAHLRFGLLTVNRLCYGGVTMAGFSACIKAHCSPAPAFRIHFPRWHKRAQRQFVTAKPEPNR